MIHYWYVWIQEKHKYIVKTKFYFGEEIEERKGRENLIYGKEI